MDMYVPAMGSVYKSVSRLTLNNRVGVTPSAFVRGIFDRNAQLRMSGHSSGADSRSKYLSSV